ncbi:hypothetical protein MAUB1S_10312 [Mycolicibacterium aubagnense]
MTNLRIKALLGAGCMSLAMIGTSNAGGFSRGSADTDILFEQGNFNMRSSVTYVTPTRKFNRMAIRSLSVPIMPRTMSFRRQR